MVAGSAGACVRESGMWSRAASVKSPLCAKSTYTGKAACAARSALLLMPRVIVWKRKSRVVSAVGDDEAAVAGADG